MMMLEEYWWGCLFEALQYGVIYGVLAYMVGVMWSWLARQKDDDEWP